MAVIESVILVLDDSLDLGGQARSFDRNTPLFEGLVELDSLAIVNVIVALEEHFDLTIEDDEITADIFETVGSLTLFIEGKLGLGR